VIRREELLRQLQEFVDSGFGGIAIMPGREMNPRLLSAEFFANLEIVLLQAEKAGLGVRLMFDFSRPWNTGMEELLHAQPDLRLQRLTLEHQEVVGTKSTFDLTVTDGDERIVLAARSKNGVISLDDASVVKTMAPGETFSWKIPQGEWKVIVLRKQFYTDPSGNYIVNVFNVKTANVFVQQVLDVIRDRMSPTALKAFKGVVTELPSIMPADNSIPWDDDLVIKYRAKHKKELHKLLPALFCDVEETSCKNRAHIYNNLLQSMYDRFALIIEGWAKKNHIDQWVLGAERSTYAATTSLRHFFVVPEVELGVFGAQNQGGIEDDYASIRAVADMNVNQFRRETVTVIGRNRLGNATTMQDIKTSIEAALLAGSSHLLIDGFFFNLDQRSYLKTPAAPWWYSLDKGYFSQLCTYVARLNEVCKGLHFSRQIAILYPGCSVLADYFPGSESVAENIGSSCNKILDTLQKNHLDFDIISEQLLLGCDVRQNGEFGTADRIRKGNYQALVIPYARLISKSVFVFIEKMASKGGTVLFVGEPPQGCLDEGVTKAFGERVQKLLASKRGTIAVVTHEKLGALLGGFAPALSATLNAKPISDIRVAQGFGDGYDVYMLLNTAVNKDHFALLGIPDDKPLTLVDCGRGDLFGIAPEDEEAQEGGLAVSFVPQQLYVIASGLGKVSSTGDATEAHPVNRFAPLTRNYRIVLKDQWQLTAVTPNVLPLSMWNTRIGLSRESGGYSHFHEAVFSIKEPPKQCRLVFSSMEWDCEEAGGIENALEVVVNGNACELERGIAVQEGSGVFTESAVQQYRNALTCNLSKHIGRGANRVSVRTIGYLGHPLPIIYPPVLVGGFSIRKDARGWVIDKHEESCGYESWVRHGFPYMSGACSYMHVFEIPSSYKRLVLRFPTVTGSIKVAINGVAVADYAWQPMELDITEICTAKRNELEITVANTIDSVLRMNGRASGLIGEVYLDVY
jgi:hypothetical protein